MGKGHTRALWPLFAVTLASAVALYGVTLLGTTVDARSAPSGGTASFTLDGVNLTLTSPMLPGRQFVTSEPGSASQVASSSALNPYREVIVIAVPFGTSPGTERLPHAHAGGPQPYRSSLVSDRSSQGGHPAPGPDASLFGQDTPSVVSVLHLHLDGPQLKRTVIVEWVAQAGTRTWLLRISRQLMPGENVNQVVQGLSGAILTSSDPNQPSTVPGTSPQPQTPPPATPEPAVPSPSPSASPVPAPTPTPTGAVTDALVRPAAQNVTPAASWWSGACDSVNNPGSYALGAGYAGVMACGPRPIAGGVDRLVQFYAGAWGEYEWECVELSMRYLYLADGVAPYSANGSQVVWNYSGTTLTQIGNGTAGQAPIAGDILSYGSTSTFGHTSIVSSSSVGPGGNGTITVVEQNNTTNGTTTMQVSNWVVQGNPYPVSGWLQLSAPPTAENADEWVATNSNGELEVFLRAGGGHFWTEYQTQAGNNASWSGWHAMAGSWPGEPAVVLDGQGRLELFARAGDGELMYAYETQAGNPASWSGLGSLGGTITKDPVAVVLSNGTVDVYAVGEDGALWHRYQTSAGNVSSWSGWGSLGGLTPVEPAPVLEPGGRVDLFVRGADNQLREDYETVPGNEQSWSGWQPLGGVVGQPAPVLESDGRVDVFVRGQDSQPWHRYQTVAGNEQSWSAWSPLGGLTPLDPVAGRNSDGRVELLVLGVDGEPWHDYQTVAGGSASWSGWGRLGGSSSSAPVVAVTAAKGLQAFMIGQDGAVWFDSEITPGSSYGWSGWSSLGGSWPAP